MTTHDDDLRTQFEALRRVDAASAPGITALLDRPVVERRWPAVLVPAAVLAAAVAVLIVSPPAVTTAPAMDVSVEPDTPSLLTWQSPTASLMQITGPEIAGPSRTVTSSLLRGTIVDPRTIQSTGR